jgi:hypothetical protein
MERRKQRIKRVKRNKFRPGEMDKGPSFITPPLTK